MGLGSAHQCSLAASQAGLLRGSNVLGGEGTPQSSWEPIETFPFQAEVLHIHSVDLCMEQYQDHGISLMRAGFHCYTAVLSSLSVQNVASFI